ERELRLEVDSRVRTALVPRLLTETQAMRLEQYGTAVVAMVYASLFTLALLALALYSAARDRMFLAFCSFSVLTLLTMAAFNGHLYSVPGLRAFALWGDMGLWALAMLYAVAWLQMLVQYVGLGGVGARARRALGGYCVVLVAAA